MSNLASLGFLSEYILKNDYNLPLNEILDDEDFQDYLSRKDEVLLK